MKFLIVTNHSYMLWQFRRELIEAMLQRGEVVIGTPLVGHEQDFNALGCRCVETKLERRGMNPLHELHLIETYKRLLKDEKPDLVISYSIKPNLYMGLLCRCLCIPYAANVQGLGTAFQNPRMAAFISAFYRIALRGAKTVFFENEANASLFVERGILPADKITCLPGAGVNLLRYPMCPYPSEEKGIRFLYLGRIMREKGMDELFTVIRRLKEEYGEKVQFDLVGFFEDDYRQTVKELCRENFICFHGFQEDPRPFYAAAHCVVLPSWHEGMSNVLLEAASTGRALIASDIPGCREAITEGETGFLTEPRSNDSLYRALKAFLGLSEEERAALGLRGREKMAHEFDRVKVVEEALKALHI